MTNEIAGRLAKQRFREADEWWLRAELALHDLRCWRVMYLGRLRIRRTLRRSMPALEETIINTKAAMNTARFHLRDAVRCAIAAELAGRIYDDEAEDRA